jgi:hypothetical protein
MIYFDTAYLAKCYLNEHGSPEVKQLAAEDGRVVCCEYGRIELAATFHRNLRQKSITPAEFRLLWKQFDLELATCESGVTHRRDAPVQKACTVGLSALGGRAPHGVCRAAWFQEDP